MLCRAYHPEHVSHAPLIQFCCLKDLPLPLKAMLCLYRSLMSEACSSLDDCSLEDLKLLQSQQQLIVFPSFAVVS